VEPTAGECPQRGTSSWGVCTRIMDVSVGPTAGEAGRRFPTHHVVGPYILWPLMDIRSMFSSFTSMGIFPTACPPGCPRRSSAWSAHSQEEEKHAVASSLLRPPLEVRGPHTVKKKRNTQLPRACSALHSRCVVRTQSRRRETRSCLEPAPPSTHLRGVGVEEDLLGATQLANLLQRLHHADLVVHRHHGHQHRLGAHRLLLRRTHQNALSSTATIQVQPSPSLFEFLEQRTAMPKLRIVTLRFGTGDRNWSLNDGQIPHVAACVYM
jgi:hypothetical protein